MQKNLIPFLLILILPACNKNKDAIYHEVFPATYSSAEWRYGKARLFTRNGEIADYNTIRSIITRNNLIMNPGTSITLDSFSTQVRFFNEDSVRLMLAGVPYLCRLKEVGNARFLTYKDTISVYMNSDYEGATYLMQIRNSFSGFPPLYESISNEPFPRYRVKPVFTMRRTNEGMEMTFIYSALCKRNYAPTEQSYVNTLNDKGYSVLKDGDSLLIQEQVLLMKRRY
jgi:hypothetical protein